MKIPKTKWAERLLLAAAGVTVCAAAAVSGVMLFQMPSNQYETGKLLVDAKKKQEETSAAKRAAFWSAMKEKYPDLKGWIWIETLSISEPVVQGKDNDFYLSHNAEKKNDKYGAVFIDADCSLDESWNLILYGHSSAAGQKFTPLSELSKKDVFEKTGSFWLITPEADYKCETVGFSQIDALKSDAYNPDLKPNDLQFDQMKYFCRNTLNENDKLITLSTCNLAYGYSSTKRNVLQAKLTESLLSEENYTRIFGNITDTDNDAIETAAVTE